MKIKPHLSYIENNKIIRSIPTDLTEEEIVGLDEFLRSLGLLKENQELALMELPC